MILAVLGTVYTAENVINRAFLKHGTVLRTSGSTFPKLISKVTFLPSNLQEEKSELLQYLERLLI